MRGVYVGAKKVVVWLGEDENGQAERAWNVIEEVTRAVQYLNIMNPVDLQSVDSLFVLMPDWRLKPLPRDTARAW